MSAPMLKVKHGWFIGHAGPCICDIPCSYHVRCIF